MVETPAGATLAELRDRLSARAIARYLAEFADAAGPDRALQTLREATGSTIDLSKAQHAVFLLNWLRAWGCRNLRVADTALSAAALKTWWVKFGSSLPSSRVTLWRTGSRQMRATGEAYESLANAVAAHRAHQGGEVDVRFGATAAAKALFALRPRLCLPWDEPIRIAFETKGMDATSYCLLLREAAGTLNGLARRLGVGVAELPMLLGRPESTPPQMVDEYLWIRANRGL